MSTPRRRRPVDREERPSKQKKSGGSDLGARVLVAIPAIIFAIAIIRQGGEIFALGMLALGLVAMHELYSMFDDAKPVRIAGFLALIGLLAAAEYGTQYNVVLVLAATFPVLFLFTVMRRQREGNTVATAITLLGVFWIGAALAHAVLLRELPHGDAILVDVLVGTFIGDTGAYLGGRMFGRRPLAPQISPNKTVEGLVIGMFFAASATWFAGLYQDWLSGTDALIIGLVVAVLAPIGDLFESLIKRDAGTKDTGRLFGAHGGALDRLDAVFFSVPAGYYVWFAML